MQFFTISLKTNALLFFWISTFYSNLCLQQITLFMTIICYITNIVLYSDERFAFDFYTTLLSLLTENYYHSWE